MTPDEITAFFSRRRAARASGDVATLVADYAEDCVLESPAAGTVVGRAAIEQWVHKTMAALPDLRIQVEDLIVMGERVVMLATLTCNEPRGSLGSFLGGRPFSTRFIVVYVFKDDKILRERIVYDFSGILLERVQQELTTAAQIQRALLPVGRISGAGYEAFAESLPCRQIGGDFVDFFRLPDGALGLVLGDVAGKGPPAALMAAMLQGVFATRTGYGGTPAEVIADVNRACLRRAVESRFATALYAVLSADGRLTSCNAGHNPPLLIGRHGVRRLAKGGCILGMFEHAGFEQESVQLEAGDELVVFSDGITEAANPQDEDFGDDRLVSWALGHRDQPPAEFVGSLLDEVKRFTVGTVQGDDLTCLVLQYSGGSA